jgi:hypothetical protein
MWRPQGADNVALSGRSTCTRLVWGFINGPAPFTLGSIAETGPSTTSSRFASNSMTACSRAWGEHHDLMFATRLHADFREHYVPQALVHKATTLRPPPSDGCPACSAQSTADEREDQR